MSLENLESERTAERFWTLGYKWNTGRWDLANHYCIALKNSLECMGKFTTATKDRKNSGWSINGVLGQNV